MTAKTFDLAKMVEEVKILAISLTDMDALTKSWYMMIRDRIGKEVMSTQEPPVVPPMREEPQAEEEAPPVMEEPEVEEVVPPPFEHSTIAYEYMLDTWCGSKVLRKGG
jgi:hypothetical protein